jgi:cytochrome c oxidase assembly protein subunit 15
MNSGSAEKTQSPQSPQSHQSFIKFAWFVLAYTVLVIAWGAFVRATGSGAGCGEHWPLCNGEVIPRDAGTARLIEFSHRLSSGLSLIFVAILVIWSRKIYAAGHKVRSAAMYSLVFILGEAAVGAMLVVLQLVAGNDSVLRAIVIALHLINTFFLLFWQTRCAYVATTGFAGVKSPDLTRARINIMLCLAAFAVTGATGAIVALGDTLFPTTSLAAGITADFSPTAHFLIRLRIWHPVVAVMATVYIALQAIILPRLFSGRVSRTQGLLLLGLIIAQLIGGVVNLLLLAPVWMQLFHLIFADIVWIALCIWYFSVGRDENHNSGRPL